MTAEASPDEEKPPRRRYDSPVRRQQAEETRERIARSGVAIVKAAKTWSWEGLTFSAVAAHAGVGESTVYRYFAKERDLREAVLHQLQHDAGVSYDALRPEDLPIIATQVFTALTGFAVSSQEESQDPLPDQDLFRRQALLEVVADAAPAWSERDRVIAAAALDVLWNVPSYERLVSRWGMTTPEATETIRWAMRRLIEAFAPESPSRDEQRHGD